MQNRSLIFALTLSGTLITPRLLPAAPGGRDGDQTFVVKQNNHRLTHSCRGGSVLINSNRNVIILRGRCSDLTVNGHNNVIRAESVGTINTVGNRNRVTWKNGAFGRHPRIINLGRNNRIRRG